MEAGGTPIDVSAVGVIQNILIPSKSATTADAARKTHVGNFAKKNWERTCRSLILVSLVGADCIDVNC